MSVVAKYLNELTSGGGFVYRGQSDESWGLTSTYYRRFNLNKSGDKQQQPTQQQFQDYHTTLIKDAKSYHYHKEELSDLELLLELQHYGAATGLVDFSRDFLIALWFACNSKQDNDGSVFVLNSSNIDKFTRPKSDESIFSECDKLQFINSNFKSNNRIFAQKGVFVFSNQTIDNTEPIPILKKDKKPILQELSDRFSINEKSLFQDIYGFSMVNDVNHPIYEKTTEEYILEGNQYYQKYKFEKAIEAYEKAIEIDLDSDIACYNIGLAYAKLSKFEKAIEAYEKAIEIKPDKYETYYGIGFAYAKLSKFEKAIEAYEKAIEIKPDSHEAYYNMGVAYFRLGKYQKEIEAYKKAIEIKPDSHEAYDNMGAAYTELGEFKEAIEAHEKAIKIKPDSHKAYYNMGVAYTELGEFKEAIEAHEKAIKIKPDSHKAYCNMGVAYARLSKFKEAIEAYKKAIEIKPSHKAYYNMGGVYFRLGKYQKALEAYEKAIVLNSASIIKLSKQQNWYPLEQWINNLTDNDKKQQYLQTLKILKNE